MCTVRTEPSGAHDAELAVDRPAVHQAAGDHRGQRRLVLGEEPGRQLVEGQRAVRGVAAEDPVQLVGPLHLVGEQVPLGAAGPAERAAARRVRRPVLRRRASTRQAGSAADVAGRSRPRELAQVGAEVVELVHGEVAQRALPAAAAVLGRGAAVAADGVDLVPSRRACEISASTVPGSGGWAAG